MHGFGHGGGRRYTKDDLLPPDAEDGRKAGHNRVTFTYPDGSRAFRLYFTDVVRVFPNGDIVLDDGGYPTMTTRRAIGEGVEALLEHPCWVYGDNAWGHVVNCRERWDWSTLENATSPDYRKRYQHPAGRGWHVKFKDRVRLDRDWQRIEET